MLIFWAYFVLKWENWMEKGKKNSGSSWNRGFPTEKLTLLGKPPVRVNEKRMSEGKLDSSTGNSDGFQSRIFWWRSRGRVEVKSCFDLTMWDRKRVCVFQLTEIARTSLLCTKEKEVEMFINPKCCYFLQFFLLHQLSRFKPRWKTNYKIKTIVFVVAQIRCKQFE